MALLFVKRMKTKKHEQMKQKKKLNHTNRNVEAYIQGFGL